jgi:maltose-binding protein MalE
VKALSLIVVALILVAGCGGGTSTTTQTATVTEQQTGGKVTKAEFIKQADAICERCKPQAQANENKMRDLQQGGLSGDEVGQAADLLRDATSNAERRVTRCSPYPPARCHGAGARLY